MPLFIFTNKRGDRREVLLPQAEDHILADGQVWTREKVASFAFTGQASAPTMGTEVLRGYREQEIIMGSRFRSRMPAETVKKVWANDAGDQ
jgi:hypothetical protein